VNFSVTNQLQYLCEFVVPAMKAGMPKRVEFEYRRHGTTCLLAARDVSTGQVTGWCNPTRTEEDFNKFIIENGVAN